MQAAFIRVLCVYLQVPAPPGAALYLHLICTTGRQEDAVDALFHKADLL